ERAGGAPALHGGLGVLESAVERAGASQRARHTREVFAEERALRGLAVESEERRHRHDVPGVVLDHGKKSARVAAPEEVEVARADVAGGDVVDALEAEDVALDRDETAPLRHTLSMDAPRAA